MRTLKQIEEIKKTFSPPRAVSGFLSSQEIEQLISLYYSNSNSHVHKNTGPVTLDIFTVIEAPIIKNILKKIETEIGPFEVTAGLFFRTDYPHIIHNDDTFELPDNVFKAIAIPLTLYGNFNTYPKLCFFNQHYFYGPAKFFNGDTDVSTYYNVQVYNYDNVEGTIKTPFFDKTNYFTHLKPQWLRGLSLHSALDWIPGSALIFDSVQLHCASDFRSLGVTSKLGLSIFTKKIS